MNSCEAIIVKADGTPIIDLDPFDLPVDDHGNALPGDDLEGMIAAADDYTDQFGVTTRLVWDENGDDIMAACTGGCGQVKLAILFGVDDIDGPIVCNDCAA